MKKLTPNIKVYLFVILILGLIIFWACRKYADNNQYYNNITNAVEEVLNIPSVHHFIKQTIIREGTRETINTEDFKKLSVPEYIIEVFNKNNIEFLYFPFIDEHGLQKEKPILVNLNQQLYEDSIQDINGVHLNKEDIIKKLTVMFKTQAHIYDSSAYIFLKTVTEYIPNENESISNKNIFHNTSNTFYVNNKIVKKIALEGGWLPWRRCYCTRGSIFYEEDVESISSVGSCSLYHQAEELAKGHQCGRTGFINQNCSGAPCAGS